MPERFEATRHPLRRRRVAAVLTILGTMVASCGPVQPSPPVGTSEPDASSSVPSPSETQLGDTPTWIGLAIPDPRPDEHQGEEIHDAVAGGPGFVAVGRSIPCCGVDRRDNNSLSAGIWTSVDGITWNAVDTSALGLVELRRIAAGPDGMLLAIGEQTLDRLDEEPPSGIGMWRSDDGIEWEAAAGPKDGEFHYDDVVGTDAGWVVVGSRSTGPNTGGPVVLFSSDLETWGVDTLPEGGYVEHMAVNPDGQVLITGFYLLPEVAGQHERESASRGWIGRPGDWEVVEPPETPSGQELLGVIDDGFLLIDGYNADAGTWRSTDGRTWEPGPPWPAGDGGEDGSFAGIETMATTSQGLVVGGGIVVGDDDWVPAVWRLGDGVHWSPMELLPLTGVVHETSIRVILETPAGIVALGSAFYDKPELKYDWPEAAGWIWR